MFTAGPWHTSQKSGKLHHCPSHTTSHNSKNGKFCVLEKHTVSTHSTSHDSFKHARGLHANFTSVTFQFQTSWLDTSHGAIWGWTRRLRKLDSKPKDTQRITKDTLTQLCNPTAGCVHGFPGSSVPFGFLGSTKTSQHSRTQRLKLPNCHC